MTKFATKLYGTNVRFIHWASHHYFNFQNEIKFFSNTTMGHWNIAIQKAFVVDFVISWSSLMSWHNIIFTLFSNLFKSMGIYNARARCLVADDAFTAFSDNDRRSTTLSISDGNVCIAVWKRVDDTSNICCNIATGTYQIWADRLADIWILRSTSFSVRRVT